MTFAHLDSLQKIICEELDLIRRIYAGLSESRVHSTSPGPRDEDIHVETLLDPPSIFAPYHSLGIDSDNESDSATAPAPHNVSGLAYASPPPSPSVVRFPATPSSLTSSSTPCSHKNSPSSSTQQSQQSSSFSLSLDWPNLDEVYDPSSAAEALTQHPDVIQASQKVIAACHHVAAILQAPFLTICDASMGYHLPSCLRLVEASHTIEILRDAGPSGMPVSQIAERNGVSKSKLAHVLRLLSTHHLLREVSPDTFALNRLSSLIDTGKSIEDLKASDAKGCPEEKYHDTNGVSAFVGMCTDEVAKASAYLTEAWYLSPEIYVTHGRDPTRAPFNFAFGLCGKGDEGLRLGMATKDSKSPLAFHRPPRDFGDNVGFFQWLEGEGLPQTGGVNSNKFRLERFGKAMTGSSSWEHKGAILEAFDWQALPRGSLIVDVGGGIGSLTEQLATAFGEGREMTDLGFKFVVQDREGVVNMAKEMWAKSRPDLLHRVVEFQVHDFFTPQPLRKVAVFILRVVLHDWPDSLAQKILLRLREVATSDTKLILGDFMLSFACADVGDDDTQGFQRATPQAPLLANLGKASANAYWMDLTMQVVFNSLERTRQEIYDLCLSAGWKVTKVSRSPGSAFCYIVAVPTDVPIQTRTRSGSDSAFFDVPLPGTPIAMAKTAVHSDRESDVVNTQILEEERFILECTKPRCGTPTFGSEMKFRSEREGPMSRFSRGFARGGEVLRSRIGLKTSQSSLRHPLVISTPMKKMKPSPLSPTSNAASIASSSSASLQKSPHYVKVSARGSQAAVSSESLAASLMANSPPPKLAHSPRLPMPRHSNSQIIGSTFPLLSQKPASPKSVKPTVVHHRGPLAQQLPGSCHTAAKSSLINSRTNKAEEPRRGSSMPLADSSSSIPVRSVPEHGSPVRRRLLSRRGSLANLSPRKESPPPLPVNPASNGSLTPISPTFSRPDPPHSPTAKRSLFAPLSGLRIGMRRRSESVAGPSVVDRNNPGLTEGPRGSVLTFDRFRGTGDEEESVQRIPLGKDTVLGAPLNIK